MALHGDAGFEPNEFGTSWWATGALYGRLKPIDWLYLAARGDVFREEAAANDSGEASRIFWPAELIGSGTFTVDLRPRESLSLRVEYRHDEADAEMFFDGHVAIDLATGAYLVDASSQDTLTVGATGWF